MSAGHHIVPVRVYIGIILTLMVLTIVTVLAAFVDFGIFNLVIALAIAVIKALLVVMFFMHLKYSVRILWLYAGAGVAFFIILIAFLLSDYRSREWLSRPQAWDVAPAAASVAPGPGAPSH